MEAIPVECGPAMRIIVACSLLLLALPVFSEPLTVTARQWQALGLQTVGVPESGSGVAKGFPATVQVPAGQIQILVAPLEGTLVEMKAVPGVEVRRGQVVAVLVSPQALELQGAYAEASARARQTSEALKRDQQLHQEGIIAAARLESTRALAGEASARLEQARQSLNLAGGKAGRMGPQLELKASLDGVVLEQLVKEGERLPVATPIARIAHLKPLWLEIRVPQQVAAKLRLEDVVQLSRQSVMGKVISIGRAVDMASQSVVIRAQVDQGSESLSPGQAVEVQIRVEGLEGLPLPSSAVVHQKGDLFAFVLKSGDEKTSAVFEARPIQKVSQVGNTVLVSGLKPGERVAVQGVSGLKAMLNGMGGE